MNLPKPYYQDEAVTIYHGDCREILPMLHTVQLVITSPPYNQADNITRSRGRKARWYRMNAHTDWYPDNLCRSEYENQQCETLNLCGDVLTSDGSILYNHKNDHEKRRVHHPFQWISRATKIALVEEIIWAQPYGLPKT
jgi:DNA modification methylase